MTRSQPLQTDFSYLDHGSRQQNGPPQAPPREPAGRHGKAYMILLACLLVILAVVDGAPVTTLAAAVVSLLPAALAAYVISRLSSDEMPKGFLFEQIFWGALPGFWGALLAEFVLIIFAVLTFLRHDLANAAAALKQPGQDRAITMVQIARELGVLKVVMIALLVAYVLAAGVEESVKLLIGQRAKMLVAGGSLDIGLSAQSLVAAVMAGALGLAAAEHFFFTLKIFTATRFKFPKSVLAFAGAVALSLGRAVLAFPIHCGTALIIGVAMARKIVLRENVRIAPSFAIAIFVHGTFDAVSMVISGLVAVKVLPVSIWIGVGVLASDICITIALMLYCRGSYKALGTNGGYASLNGDSHV